MPIADLLMKHFDELKRNSDGTIVYDSMLKEISENLLKYERLNSEEYHTYDEFFNAVTNNRVIYDKQQKENADDIQNHNNGDQEEKINFCEQLNELEEKLYNSKGYIRSSKNNIFKLAKGCKSEFKYVNDIFTKSVWQFWQPGEQVFVSAGTGRGKNTFIKKELLKHININQKVVIFENRQSLMQQQVIDIVSEIAPDALKYNDISKDNMVTFGHNKNIMIISYQAASLKCILNDSDFLNFCSQARYLIFDEAHYILDDSLYNKGINFFIQTFLFPIVTKDENNNDYRIPSFPNSTKIFMSGTMDEVYEYIQQTNRFPRKPFDFIESKETLNLDNPNSSLKILRGYGNIERYNYVLSMPTDYSYIEPYKYKNLEDICSQIEKTPADEKWLIFVKSVEEGARLQGILQKMYSNNVCFLNAENKESSRNKEIYSQLIHECKFGCRILIATTVIYNGVNVKDNAVKHIVVPFTTMSVLKQLIGRKRITENEIVNVYFPDVTYDEIKKRYYNCIKDCMEIINLNSNLPGNTLCQLNGLVNSSSSKYYYLTSQKIYNANGSFITMMMPVLSLPAIYKLYYDTCFYIFVLQRMNPELENKTSDFVKILLTHLDIGDKYDKVIDIIVKTLDEKIEESKIKFSEYLDSLTGIDIISPDEKGSYEAFLELKFRINDIHKILHEGKSLDIQWKNEERFFSENKVKTLFSELNLPYIIQSENSKGKRTTKIIKQSSDEKIK